MLMKTDDFLLFLYDYGDEFGYVEVVMLKCVLVIVIMIKGVLSLSDSEI